MNLIVSASLSEPPTEGLVFRHIIYTAHKQLNMNCLIEVEQDMKDAYYKFLFRRGLLDDVEQIVTPPEKVLGLRLSNNHDIPPCIPVDSITWTNFKNIIGLIQAVSGK